jgi:hypothetical protein
VFAAITGTLGLLLSFFVHPIVLECKLFTQCREMNIGYALASLFDSNVGQTLANEQLALQVAHSIAFTIIFGLLGFGSGFVLEQNRRPNPAETKMPKSAASSYHGAAHANSSLELIGCDRFADHYLKVEAAELADMPCGLSVGRDPTHVMFPVSDDSVSREHAHIRLHSGSFVLEDSGSTNGTHINGRMLARNETAHLRSGDRVMFGSAAFDIRAS